LTVKFEADAFDADGPESEITYLWDFGDEGAALRQGGASDGVDAHHATLGVRDLRNQSKT